MDLRQLEVFHAVCEERSFSRAAERLDLSQPTVSGHIKALERFFGTVLLDRLGRETVPTAAGELLYRHSAQLLEGKRLALEAMSRLLGGLEGDLSLGASTIPGEYLLPVLIGRFHEGCPGVRIRVEISDSRAVIRDVEEGRVELGFVGAQLAEGDVEFRRFASDRLVLAVPATERWREVENVSFDALREEPLVLRERGSGTRATLERRLAEAGYGLRGFNVVAEFGSTAAVKEAVRAGVGWSVLSDLALRTETAAGLIRSPAIDRVGSWERSFFVVRDPRRTTSPSAEGFLDLVTSGRVEPGPRGGRGTESAGT